MLYLCLSADQPNAVVEVKCYEPVVTTVAPIHYTNQFQDYGNRYNRLDLDLSSISTGY